VGRREEYHRDQQRPHDREDKAFAEELKSNAVDRQLGDEPGDKQGHVRLPPGHGIGGRHAVLLFVSSPAALPFLLCPLAALLGLLALFAFLAPGVFQLLILLGPLLREELGVHLTGPPKLTKKRREGLGPPRGNCRGGFSVPLSGLPDGLPVE